MIIFLLTGREAANQYYLQFIQQTPFRKSSFGWLLTFLFVLSMVLKEIIDEEVAATYSGIKKGRPGYNLILSIHILVAVGVFLLFLNAQFF